MKIDATASEKTDVIASKKTDAFPSETECKKDHNPVPCPGFIDLADFGLNRCIEEYLPMGFQSAYGRVLQLLATIIAHSSIHLVHHNSPKFQGLKKYVIRRRHDRFQR